MFLVLSAKALPFGYMGMIGAIATIDRMSAIPIKDLPDMIGKIGIWNAATPSHWFTQG